MAHAALVRGSSALLLAAGWTLGCLPAPTEPVRYQETEGTRPLFRVQGSTRLSAHEPAGHGFLVDLGAGVHVALTAYHVAGPEESAAPISPGVWAFLRTPFSPSTELRLGERIAIPEARVIGTGSGTQLDLGAFQVLDWDPTRALELAADIPDQGDTVWVLALHIPRDANAHPLGGPRRHPARVEIANDSDLVYSYLASANADFTSGAAVLDSDGRVVGVNVGTRVMTAASWQSYRDRYPACCVGAVGGEIVGLAVNVRSIRALLSAAP